MAATQQTPTKENELESLFEAPVDKHKEVNDVLGERPATVVSEEDKQAAEKKQEKKNKKKKQQQSKSVFIDTVQGSKYMKCVYSGELVKSAYVLDGPVSKHAGPFLNIAAAGAWLMLNWKLAKIGKDQAMKYLEQLKSWLPAGTELTMDKLKSISAPPPSMLEGTPNADASALPRHLWLALFPECAGCEPPIHTVDSFIQKYQVERKVLQAEKKAKGETKPRRTRKGKTVTAENVVINNCSVTIGSGNELKHADKKRKQSSESSSSGADTKMTDSTDSE